MIFFFLSGRGWSSSVTLSVLLKEESIFGGEVYKYLKESGHEPRNKKWRGPPSQHGSKNCYPLSWQRRVCMLPCSPFCFGVLFLGQSKLLFYARTGGVCCALLCLRRTDPPKKNPLSAAFPVVSRCMRDARSLEGEVHLHLTDDTCLRNSTLPFTSNKDGHISRWKLLEECSLCLTASRSTVVLGTSRMVARTPVRYVRAFETFRDIYVVCARRSPISRVLYARDPCLLYARVLPPLFFSSPTGPRLS